MKSVPVFLSAALLLIMVGCGSDGSEDRVANASFAGDPQVYASEMIIDGVVPTGARTVIVFTIFNAGNFAAEIGWLVDRDGTSVASGRAMRLDPGAKQVVYVPVREFVPGTFTYHIVLDPAQELDENCDGRQGEYDNVRNVTVMWIDTLLNG